jgi:hypothetical protein
MTYKKIAYQMISYLMISKLAAAATNRIKGKSGILF